MRMMLLSEQPSGKAQRNLKLGDLPAVPDLMNPGKLWKLNMIYWHFVQIFAMH